MNATEKQQKLKKGINLFPFESFFKQESAGGILLMFFACLALAWANSPWANWYEALWETKVTVGLGNFILSKPLLLWINDGLMTFFFFLVGLEIKREIIAGELSSLRGSLFPIAAAVGGMVFPALIYKALNYGTPGAVGWGIPMATDIAFALGILLLLGRRAPLGLKVFLTAVAIVDDIGAILVIAIFYTEQVYLSALGLAAIFLALMALSNKLNIKAPLVYFFLGIMMWLFFLKSGIHATIAGVLAAITIPARTTIDTDDFAARTGELLSKFANASKYGLSILTNRKQQGLLHAIRLNCEQAESPLQQFVHELHFWVAFGVMPIFAFANAGINLGENFFSGLLHPIPLGVILGLVVGKQVGIVFSVWMLVRLKLSALPQGVSWRHIYGASCLAGIGFTMSLFVAGLAFSDPALLHEAKSGILIASFISAVIGWNVLKKAPIDEKAAATDYDCG